MKETDREHEEMSQDDAVTPAVNESFFDKGMRKFKAEPMVPLGALLTTVFLIAGLSAFKQGKIKQSQKMMRARVLAQGFCFFAMGLAAISGFQPHDRPKTFEEVRLYHSLIHQHPPALTSSYHHTPSLTGTHHHTYNTPHPALTSTHQHSPSHL